MIDDEKIKAGVKLLLEGMGEDLFREGLLETPDRVARMYHELFAGYEMDPKEILSKRFKVESSEMVVEKDIVFYSTCEHHLLPFFGKVHIAYIPKGEVVGLSKLARLVEVYARRPQIQEQMTNQIADAIYDILKPEGVCVLVNAEHMCMTMRGIKKTGSTTATIALRGAFKEDANLKNQFFELLKL